LIINFLGFLLQPIYSNPKYGPGALLFSNNQGQQANQTYNEGLWLLPYSILNRALFNLFKERYTMSFGGTGYQVAGG
jgi:hypothetical protein